jgi:hypothetical protein
MARMVRKQLYIGAEHEEKLKQVAEALGVTEAEVVRRAIAGLSLPPDNPSSAEWQEALDTLERLLQRVPPASESLGWSRTDTYRDYARAVDDKAWQEEREFIEERARLLPRGGSTKRWRREDSYGDSRTH